MSKIFSLDSSVANCKFFNKLMSFYFLFEYIVIIGFMAYTIYKSLGKYHDKIGRDTLISPTTSHVLKAVSCVIILLHHFALREHVALLSFPFKLGGAWALPVFFLLSSYGIAQSEKKHTLKLKEYFNKRILKLMKPWWCVNIVFLIVYWLIGANLSQQEMTDARIWPMFSQVGRHDISLSQFLLLILGIKELDGVVWFAEVTLFSYISFFVCKCAFPIHTHRTALTIAYTICILTFGVITWQIFHIPAHYYRNLWALLAGLYLSLYEKEILESSKWKTLSISLFTIALIPLAIESLILAIVAIFAVVSIFMFNKTTSTYYLKNGSFILLLSGMSYVFYLVHVKFLTIEYYYMGYISVLLPFACCMIFSYFYKYISSKIALLFNK